MDSPEKKEYYRKRLKYILGKKIQTTMVFPLSQFELEFGYLWGDGKNYEDLTDEEKNNRMKWERLREKVLDVGNRQKKNLNSEINMHDVIWHQYNYELKPVNGNFINEGNH